MSYTAIDKNFESKKNIKAFGITVAITGGLFLLFFLMSWTLPQTPPPPVDDGVEVNLGNSDQGLGDVPPQVPGEPSDQQQTNVEPPPSAAATTETSKEVAENNEADAPPINTSPKPEVKPVTHTANAVSHKKKVQPVVNPTPVPPKPKAVYAGGASKSNGGNNADDFNNVRNQGIAGGHGDQGKPNGNPNSDSYTGNGGTGTSGIAISSGLHGRRITSAARFEDTYKYGGKVSVDVVVDANGNVTSASVKPGSPFADLNNIAVKRAKQLKFSKADADQNGTVIIVFENPKG
jgi:TonB family protein